MIYRQEGYTLIKSEAEAVLLPYGQQAADHKQSVRLNETGVFLWEALAMPKTKEMLAEEVCAYYGAEDSERAVIMEDVGAFVSRLLGLGILREDFGCFGEPFCACVKIAGIFIGLYGQKEVFADEFKPFFAETKKECDMKIEVIDGVPISRQTGQLLVQTREMSIGSWDGGFIVRFHTMKNIQEAYMTADGRYVRIYCLLSWDMAVVRENVFHAIRLFFLYLAQKKGLTALHSASILYRDKAWLFCGPSGTGKSTHAALWHNIYGTPYLNGDLNLVGKDENGCFLVHGIPWCGTSGISTTKTYPLGGLVFLRQAPHNTAKTLTAYYRKLKAAQRMISPAWTAKMAALNFSRAGDIAGKVSVFELECTKEEAAAKTAKAYIDRLEAAEEA